MAKKNKLPKMQLFNLENDRGETTNLIDEQPEKTAELLKLLQQQVESGRCTPGQAVSNDREVTFLPPGAKQPK